MPSVTIDAGVLAAPPAFGSAAEADRYVETLLDWSMLLHEPWVAIYMSERASVSLYEDGLLPLRERLKELFAANGIVKYSVYDVARVVDRLLSMTPSFETFFSVKDVLVDNLTTEPDLLKLCSGTQLQSDLARCIVLIAILRQHCREPVRDHSLILRHAPQKTVAVRAIISLLEHERDDLGSMPEPPAYFDGDVLVCDDFRGLVECLDEAAILLRAGDGLGVETAIRVALYKQRLVFNATPAWDDVPAYRVGGKFLASFQDLSPTQELADRILRAVVATLEGANMKATHALRTGPGGNDPQRRRRSDSAKAWRRDVDRDRHLHYWECADGLVELASASFPHDDFSIPE